MQTVYAVEYKVIVKMSEYEALYRKATNHITQMIPYHYLTAPTMYIKEAIRVCRKPPTFQH